MENARAQTIAVAQGPDVKGSRDTGKCEYSVATEIGTGKGDALKSTLRS